ncbi:MAG TPA: hypothetical protein DCQ28_12605 [Bacteroidetes bacterium]|nr:hypothetical protein [Bacteroidota bacterium]
MFNSCSTTRDFTADETNTFYSFNPETRVLINSPKEMDQSKQTILILYALPNGNTIEMTAGKKIHEGDDWHFDIQHIAAQVRFLRQTLKEHTIIVAYLETAQKSWPAWRKKYEYKDSEVARVVDYVRFETGNPENVIISGHSGGGSFINGFVNSSESIPNFISRIVYLDANYSYDDSLEHGKKFINWLNADTTHKLCVIAYDDREIMLNGKKVVSPTGGTYRATQRMIQRFSSQTDITMKQDSTLIKYFAFNNRARFIVHTNPDTLILHTVLVAKNGLIHSVLLQTELEEKNYSFFGERAYSNLIND